MLKTKKLLPYLALLLIPLVLAIVLFVYTGSGYRLSEQEASAIAYKNAGVSTNEVTQSQVTKTQAGFHGRYDVHFSTADDEFSYTIDGQSGSIVKHESKQAPKSAVGNSEDSKETEPSSQSVESSPTVTKEAALTTALNHAGLIESSVANIKNDLRDDAGGQVYDISFDYATNGLRYKYAINAQSGAIVTYTTEYLPGVAASNTYTAQ